MEWYGQDFDIDVALLPVGDDFTMGPSDAARAAKMLRAGLVIPIHWGTFPLLTGDPGEFVQRAAEAGIEARKLEAGQAFEF